jgi:hypothetical protein
MKLLTTFFIITFFFIDTVQNAPVLHSIDVHTIPSRLVTAKPTSDRVLAGKVFVQSSKYSWWYSSSSTQSTDLTSSSASTTTHHHSSWWNNPGSAGQIIFRVFLYVVITTLVCKLLERICKSKKQEKCKKESTVVVKNKMCVSTINGQREESPPSYPEIHKVFNEKEK